MNPRFARPLQEDLMHLPALGTQARRPLLLLATVLFGGVLVMGCPSKDSTGTEYVPPETSAPQP